MEQLGTRTVHLRAHFFSMSKMVYVATIVKLDQHLKQSFRYDDYYTNCCYHKSVIGIKAWKWQKDFCNSSTCSEWKSWEWEVFRIKWRLLLEKITSIYLMILSYTLWCIGMIWNIGCDWKICMVLRLPSTEEDNFCDRMMSVLVSHKRFQYR